MAHLIITREFPPQDGGISRYAYDMADHLVKKGDRVVVLTWALPLGKWPERFSDQDQPFEIVRLSEPKRRFWQIIKLFFAALKVSRKFKVKKVWATSWNFSGVAAKLLKVFMGQPYLLFTNGYEVSSRAVTDSMDRWLLKWSLRGAQYVVAISRVTKDCVLERVPGFKQIGFLPLGVDGDKFHPGSDPKPVQDRFRLGGKKVMLTVARLYPRKGHDRVLNALPMILQKVPNAYYLIVGVGGEMENLKKQVLLLGLESYVGFAGYVQERELPSYYAACDVFVLPNREIRDSKDPWVGDFEGFGLVFIEASAVAKPVIGGRSGGSVDAIIEGQTGLLVDPLNSNEIAEAVAKILSDDQLAQRMGQSGRKWVEEELNWPVLLKRYEDFFVK